MCSKAAPENRAAASGSTHLTGVHDAAGVVDVSALRCDEDIELLTGTILALMVYDV